MREIKFRANRKEDDKVVFGNLLNHKTIGEVGAGLESYSYSEVKAETIGQFTGFTDKNGNEIFEGDNLTDVVETDEGKGNSKQKVFWNEPTGSWHLDNSFEQDETNSTELWIKLNDFKYEILT